MNDNRNERRRANGSRLEGRALAVRVASEITGQMLSMAFVAVRSAGFRLCINKLDGVPATGLVAGTGPKVMVDVVGGYVRKSWASE